DVRDLELATARWAQGLDDVEDVGWIAVQPDHGMRGPRGGAPGVDSVRLLDDVGHAAVLVVHDDAEVLWVADLLHEDPGAERMRAPVVQAPRLRLFENVVPDHADRGRAPCEVLRHPDDLRDAARLRLHLVREIQLEYGIAA